MYATLEHIESITPTIRTFWFRPERPVRYIAGQFTELYLPHDKSDERGIRRWFTLSSSPTEEFLGITTNFAPGLGSSFKRRLAAIPLGTKLHLADPMGDFVLPKDPTIPIVFVAAGLGITPVRSMIKWLHDIKEQRTIHLIYAVPRSEDIAFEPLFGSYNLTFTPIVKIPAAGYTGQTGRLDSERLTDLIGDSEASLIYLSGPEIMVETFYKELQVKGISPDRLVADYFPGYTS